MNIVTDISKNIQWVIRKAVYNSFTITFLQNASAFNISSYVFSLNIRKIGSDTNVVSLTEANSKITNGGSSGILTIILNETDSNLLNDDVYYWELKYIFSTKNYTLLQGSAKVNKQIGTEDVETSLTISVSLTGTNLDAEITIVGAGGGGEVTLASLGTTLQTAASDTPLDADTFNFYDAVDAVLKKITWVNIKATLKTYFDTLYAPIGGGGAGSDTTAIHDNEANEISAITEKTVPTDDDLYIIEDSQSSNVKKKAKRSSLFTWDRVIKGATLNRLYGSGDSYDANTTSVTGVNTLRASPFQVINKMTLDLIQAEVSTGVALSSFRIGIYADDGNCYPGALVVDSGALSGASNTVVSTAISVTLQPGLYWFAILADASITMRSWAAGQMPNIMGTVSTMGSVTRQAFYTVSQAFGALPPTFTSGATVNNSAAFITQILVRAI